MQDVWQDFQVSNAEFSLDLHVPNVSLDGIHTPPVVHNDRALTEFVQGEERCLKFINQDLMFLQESHIPSTFTNVSHTPTPLKESLCITLPTHINNYTTRTQTIQPALGFTPVEICRAQNEPTLPIPQLLSIEPCKDYTNTPSQTLDGLHVTQPKRFLPLAQEARKLAEEFHKEEIASQWAGHPLEKLLQESFTKQLEALQSLDQLAPFTAAKDHLPGDIIDILECLGKADNIPFNQLYNLAEDCTDRYYTKVIQTLTRLMKNSFHDRQLVLVNTARALKFSKHMPHNKPSCGKCSQSTTIFQTIFTTKKTTLQTEFDLLKTATSKNIQNIFEMVQSQQAHITVLSGHINTLYTKLGHLDKQVQIHCIYPHPQSDTIQLNTLDYDPDIDGDPDPVTEVQPPNEKTNKEDTTTVPLSQKTTLPFTGLPIGLSISPQKFYQISTAMNMTTSNNNEQNIPVITAPNWRTSQN